MTSLRNLNKTLLGNTSTSTSTSRIPATAKSVLERLKSLSPRITSSSNSPLENLSSTEMSHSHNTLDSLKTFLRYFFAILLIAFIVLNVLASIDLLPPVLADLFRPILIFFGYNIGETIRQTTDVSDEGAKELVTAISKTVDAGVDVLEEKSRLENDSSTIKALSNAAKKNKQELEESQQLNPDPDDADSRTQSGSKKSGYCYIGEDRGFRSCIKVGINDNCMSGDIFPTEEICINPSLRL